MSREENRKGYFSRNPRNRERERDVRNRDSDRPDYRGRRDPRKSRSTRDDKRRSRSPRKNDKDMLDENILSEITKLPEPSQLWDIQLQDGRYPAPPPPAFHLEAIPNPTYPGSTYQPSYFGKYDDFPSLSSVPGVPCPMPPEIASWSLPPPPSAAMPATFITNSEDQLKKKAAIESEMRHQKAALLKQREHYMKKAGILKKELDTLKDQRNELRGDAKRSPSPDTKRFLKENTKLQLEMQNKLKTINNVVDILKGIIGEEAQEFVEEEDTAYKPSKRKSRSPSAGHKSNYVYYDPEMHWCRVCNEFPPTAKDYLNHLHSPAHHKMAAALMEAPWHTVSGVNEGFPSFPSAPTKRTPIRGLQFFVPSTAWYCKLCDQFMGDLHCASAHLKSITHSKNYTNFVEQNPHWETDWMSDRLKAIEKARNSKVKTETKKNFVEQSPHRETDRMSDRLKASKKAHHSKVKTETKKPQQNHSKLNDVEITGVPWRKEENLFSIISALGKKVGYEFPKSEISYIRRMATTHKPIIAGFVDRCVKKKFLSAARAMKLTAGDIGAGDAERVFVNDRLSLSQKALLAESKSLKKTHGYLYVWVKNSEIHVRKNNNSPVIIISNDSDLKKLK